MSIQPSVARPWRTIAAGLLIAALAAGTTYALSESDPAPASTDLNPPFARDTPWGTVIVGEAGKWSGRLFETLDLSAAGSVARNALAELDYTSIVLLPDGTVYFEVEGRILKFAPSEPWTGAAPITTLPESPLAAGTVSEVPLRTQADGGN